MTGNSGSAFRAFHFSLYTVFRPLFAANHMSNQSRSIAISGYYGFGNVGDEAVLSGIVASLTERCPEAQLVAFSADPAVTEQLHGIRAVSRSNPAEVLGTLRHCDLLISGGGSLLQDVTSARSLCYYLAVIWLAKKLGKKTMVYAQGIGPVTRPRSRKLVRSILNRVDVITVRDAASKECLEELQVNRPEISVTADPSFGMTPVAPEEADALLRAAGATQHTPLIGVCLRPWKDEPEWLPAISQGLDAAAARIGATLVFLPMQLDQDLRMSVEVASKMNSRSAVLAGRMIPAQALAVVSKLDLLVGMRLHALIFAASSRVPFVGIAYDPKVDAFVRAVRRESPLILNDITAAQVTAEIIRAWDNRLELTTLATAEVNRLRAAAISNADIACRLIGP